MKKMIILSLAIVGLLGMNVVMSATASDISDVERDARALEFYLKDKKDLKENCPKLEWEQPHISIYKKELKPQLPERCRSK